MSSKYISTAFFIFLLAFDLTAQSKSNSIVANCARSTSREILEINNVRTTMHNGGDMWWTITSPSSAMYEIPKQDNPGVPKTHSLYAGSIWLGGINESTQELAVIANTYRQSHYSLWPGTVKNNGSQAFTDNQNCKDWDRHFKVDLTEITSFLSSYDSGLIQSEADIPEHILKWPGKGNPFLSEEISDMNHDLAPFFDTNLDGIYNPLDGDYPKIKGDQAIWWVMNDVGNEKEFGFLGVFFNIGMEVQVMTYGYATQDPLNDLTFYDYKFINKGFAKINETYIGQWVDSDLGYAGDDYVQCDIGRGMAITYNGDDFDEGISGYGSTPPAIGVDFFAGPLADLDTIGDGIDNDHDGLIDEGGNGYSVYEGDSIDNDWDGVVDEYGERISMSNFMYYNGSGNPANGNPGSAQDFFNYLRGNWRDGSLMTYDLSQGLNQNFPSTHFMFPGNSWQVLKEKYGIEPSDPALYNNWTETVTGNQPADRRFVSSIGPMTLESGAVVEYTMGVPWARDERGGAKGSFDKLLCVDDYVQSLYLNGEMEFLRGPDAPDVKIDEHKNALVLNIQPSEFNLSFMGKPKSMNTESYIERDSRIESDYEFEGYIIYQLIDRSILPEDYSNPDKARMVFQSDIKNGVGRIVKYKSDFDNGNCAYCAHLAIDGADLGLRKGVRIEKDMFSTDSILINNREYFFSVVAYAYNEKADHLNAFDKTHSAFISSKNNIKVYSGIPHEKPGSNIHFDYGESFQMKVISGRGNGGNSLEFIEGVEDEILESNLAEIIYKSESAPLAIYRNNLLVNIPDQTISIKLSSRLTYEKNGNTIEFLPGDTIKSLGDYSQNIAADKPGEQFQPNPYKKQVPGWAVVIRELENLETLNSRVLEIRLLNGVEGGAFAMDAFRIRKDGVETSNLGSEIASTDFVSLVDSSIKFTCIDFKENDFWTISANGQVFKSEYPISEQREELIPDLGLSVRINHGFNPGYRSTENGFEENGFIDADIEYENNEWLVPIDYSVLPWIKTSPISQLIPADQLNVYQNILEGSWTTWLSAMSNVNDLSISPGLTPVNLANIENLPNIDVVFTQDQSKWTRCMVIQMDQPAGSIRPRFVTGSQKSLLPSVGKDGNPDGTKALYPEGTNEDSKGYGWFPGYAIDLDGGVRLNMAFTENFNFDSLIGEGNDMLYNPNENDSNGHFIIVSNMPYDMESTESKFQYLMDSVFENQITTRSSNGGYGDVYAKVFSWIGMMKVNSEFENISDEEKGDVRVKLRVERAYQMSENGVSPEWSFELKSNSIYTNKGMSEQLDKIQVVPNPYILGSQYEKNLSENIVKITNIPPQGRIAIYGMDGTLIRVFNKASSVYSNEIETVTQEWDLKNEKGYKVNSGIYLIHIEAPGVGEIVRKFFYVKRSDSFSFQ